MNKYGNCPRCHKRFPIRAGRVEPHVRAGTRFPCKAPDMCAPAAASNLPATERTPLDRERERHWRKWRKSYRTGGMAVTRMR